MQVLYVLAMSESAQVITIVGQDVPNLKKGAYRDANTIRNNNPILQKWFPDVNEGERLIKCVNGSILEFSSFKDAQDGISNTFTIIPGALGKEDMVFSGDIELDLNN